MSSCIIHLNELHDEFYAMSVKFKVQRTRALTRNAKFHYNESFITKLLGPGRAARHTHKMALVMSQCQIATWVYRQLVYYPSCLIAQPRFSGLELGLGSRIRARDWD